MPKRGLKNFISSIFDNGDDAGFDYREPEFGMEDDKDPDEKWTNDWLKKVDSGDCPYCLALYGIHTPMVHGYGHYFCGYCNRSLMEQDYINWYTGVVPFSELLTDDEKEEFEENGEEYNDVWNNP